MNTDTEKQFIADLQQQLEQDENNIDGATQSKLTQARHNALQHLNNKKAKYWTLPSFATASIAVIAVALVTVFTLNTTTTNYSNSSQTAITSNYVMSELEYTAYIDIGSYDPIFGSNNISNTEEDDLYNWLDNLEES